MSPQLINSKKLEKVERTREIIHDLMDCDTEAEFNTVVETYKTEIAKLKLSKHVAAAIKRIQAVDINKSFNYKN